jgi:hypothetical protein
MRKNYSSTYKENLCSYRVFQINEVKISCRDAQPCALDYIAEYQVIQLGSSDRTPASFTPCINTLIAAPD